MKMTKQLQKEIEAKGELNELQVAKIRGGK